MNSTKNKIKIYKGEIPLSLQIKISYILKEIQPFYYKNIIDWFFDKIFNSSNVIYLIIENDIEIEAIAILKSTQIENKLRTLYVRKKYRNKNYGLKLINQVDKIFNSDYIFSYPEELKGFFNKIVEYKKYNITYIIQDYYRLGKKEYFVNYKPNNFKKDYR